MADEVARIDDNFEKTQLGVVDADKTGLNPRTEEEIRKVRTTNKGAVKVDTGAELSGVESKFLKVVDENSNLLKEMLVELKINNQYLSIIIGDEVKNNDIEVTQ